MHLVTDAENQLRSVEFCCAEMGKTFSKHHFWLLGLDRFAIDSKAGHGLRVTLLAGHTELNIVFCPFCGKEITWSKVD